MSDVASITARAIQNNIEFEALSLQARALLIEALNLVTVDEPEGTEPKRVKEIFSSDTTLNPNVMFPHIYGETLLSNAVAISTLAMVKVLLEVGADPNVGNMIDDETPLDRLLDEDEPSSEQEIMVHLLRANGAESDRWESDW